MKKVTFKVLKFNRLIYSDSNVDASHNFGNYQKSTQIDR